jgi:DNA-binding response OmpR family regulator
MRVQVRTHYHPGVARGPFNHRRATARAADASRRGEPRAQNNQLTTVGPCPKNDDTTILVVDDDETVRRTFAQILKFEGYRVRTATDAESGLRVAADSRPRAIILDFRMPLVNGLEFLRRLRAGYEGHETPVAMVTGDYFLDDHVLAELKSLGAVLYFKPLWLDDLVDLVRTLLSHTTSGSWNETAGRHERKSPKRR